MFVQVNPPQSGVQQSSNSVQVVSRNNDLTFITVTSGVKVHEFSQLWTDAKYSIVESQEGVVVFQPTGAYLDFKLFGVPQNEEQRGISQKSVIFTLFVREIMKLEDEGYKLYPKQTLTMEKLGSKEVICCVVL
jgi:hypothetical protein